MVLVGAKKARIFTRACPAGNGVLVVNETFPGSTLEATCVIFWQSICLKSKAGCYGSAGNPHKEMGVQLHIKGDCGGSLEVSKKQK